MLQREAFCQTGSLQRVDVTFATGAGSDGFTQDRVGGFDVEDIMGTRFLVLATPGGDRTYVALDKVIVVRTRPTDAPGETSR